MTYQVLARKWRPQVFEEVIGQSHVARALQNAVKQQKAAHAYLFSGPRGVGKTTMARILAKALNCASGPTETPCNRCNPCQEITQGSSVDVLEIDGASNTSVEDVRELRETVKYIPFQGKYKIYIIDEVHMLSNSAFNALLKTLEEPPSHMIFIFATTEPHKIPATIRSRCQHFQFKRISRRDAVAHLKSIAEKESIRLGEPELFILAKGAEGSLRDALGLLDQVLAYGGNEIRQEDLLLVMGIVDRQQVLALVRAIQAKDAAGSVGLVRGLVEQGHDLRQFCHEMVEVMRDLSMLKIASQPESLVEAPSEELEELKSIAKEFSVEELQWLFNLFAKTYEEIRNFFYPPFLLEMAVVRAARTGPIESIASILEDLNALERRIQGPASPSSAAPSTRVPSSGPSISPDLRSANPETKNQSPPVPESKPSDFSKLWQRLIQAVRTQRPYLASYLDQGILIQNTGEEISLGYLPTSSFFIDLIHKEENMRLITSLLSEVFGKSLKFRVSLLSEEQASQRRLGTPSDPIDTGGSDRNAGAHPAVREALNVLGGEVVEEEKAHEP